MNRPLLVILLIASTLEVVAQKPSDLVRKYNDFRKTRPSVRLHLVFNQDRYAPGDTAWFKAYFFNNDMLVKGRQLIDLNVVSAEENVIEHFLFAVDNGIGHNQVVFPVNTSPGIYMVTAHSEWMKNFDPAPLFAKEFMLVNDVAVGINQEVVEDDRFNIRFYPDSSRGTTEIFLSSANSTTRFQSLQLVVTNNDKALLSRTFCEGVRPGMTFQVKNNPGVTHVSVLDRVGRLVASKSFGTPGTTGIDVQIAGNADVFQTRKKTELTITLLDENKQPLQGEFSVKVLNGETFDVPSPSFQEDLVQSALKHVEPWKQILSPKTPSRFSFKTDLYRRGTAFFAEGTPLPQGTVIVFYLQQHDLVLQAQTMPGGKFTMPLPGIEGNDEVLAFAEFMDENIDGLNIKWDETAVELPAPLHTHEGDDPDVYGVFASNKRAIDRSFGFYGSETAANAPTGPLRSGLEDRLDGVDITTEVQKYVMFATMAELIREVIPSVAMKSSKGRTQVRVMLHAPMLVASSDPLYIIDGIVTRNTKYFLSLNPAGLHTVKVVTSPMRLIPLGLIGKNGIVIVETIAGSSRPPFDQWQVVEGIHPAIPFTLGSAAAVDRRHPDLRSTIFWAPRIETRQDGKATVEFFCSDDVGRVRVRVDGRTREGKPFSGEREFRVVLK